MAKPTKTSAKKPAKEAAAKSKHRPRYSPHPMLGRERGAKVRLEKDTGRSWEDWVGLARRKGPKTKRECTDWLKREHGLSMMCAGWISATAFDPDGETDYEQPEKLVGNLYSGAKAALRPLHEKVVDAALALGEDVVVTSCKTMVPIYRKHVFAELKPVEGGVLVQMSLGDVPAKGRLAKSDGRMPGDRLTHETLLGSAKDLDAEFRGWLSKAYEAGAGRMARATDAAVPPDLAKALKASKPATATWGTCTPAMQRDFIVWIESAKQAETRARRLGIAIEKLAAGKKRTY